MKKLLFIIGMLIISVSVFSQTRMLRGFSAGDHRVSGSSISVFDSITEVGAILHFYVDGAEVAAIDTAQLRASIDAYGDSITAINAILADYIEMSEITASLSDIYQPDSIVKKGDKWVIYEGATQVLPSARSDVVNAIQSMGGSIKAIGTFSDVIPLSSLGLLNQRIYLGAIYINEVSDSLSGIAWGQSTTGDYTAENNNKVGLYKPDGDSIRLVASSANDGDLWKAADSTFQTKDFSEKYLPSEPGLYYTAYLWCRSASSTTPLLGARSTNITGMNIRALVTNNHFSSGYINGQTDLPVAIALEDISKLTAVYWAAVY